MLEFDDAVGFLRIEATQTPSGVSVQHLKCCIKTNLLTLCFLFQFRVPKKNRIFFLKTVLSIQNQLFS